MGATEKVSKVPGPASADIDSERVVRDFLNAVSFMQEPPEPAACFPPEPSNADKTAKRSEKGENALDDAEGPDRAGTSVSALSEATLDTCAPGSSGKSSDVSSDGRDILKEFCLHKELIERMHLTPQELDALSHSVLLGSLISKRDILFMLRIIRGQTAEEDTSSAVYSEMAKDIRRDSLRKLAESDSRAISVRRKVRRLLVPCGGMFAAGLFVLIKMAPPASLPVEATTWLEALVFVSALVALALCLRYTISMRRFKVRPRHHILRWAMWP